MFLLKSSEVSLQGEYLVIVKDGVVTPIYNEAFVHLQNRAHKLVTLAAKVSKSDFTEKKPACFRDLVKQTRLEIEADSKREYVKPTNEAKTPTIDKLRDEALLWIQESSKNNHVGKVNDFLQDFTPLVKAEEIGLFFSTGEVVELKAIYTVKQIIEAVEILAPHLD